MANKLYWATALTGGGTGALDKIDGAGLGDLDAAVVVTASLTYVYTLDSDSAAAESSPTVISPDSNAGDKRWILVGARLANITVANAGLHILDTNSSHDLIISPGSDLSADRTLTITTGDANRTLTLNENFTIGDGTDITITGVTAARTLTLNENLTIGDGTDITITGVTAARTLTLNENLTIGDGTDITITGITQANTLTLNEGFTIGDGYTGTLTFSAASKILTVSDTCTLPTLDEQTLQIDGVNSDGGAFSFNTTGDVTFNQGVRVPYGLGVGVVPPSDRGIRVYNATLNTNANHWAVHVNVTKTAGTTDYADTLVGGSFTAQLNQNGGTIGNFQGLEGKITLTDGNIGDASNVRNVQGLHYRADLNGGKVYGGVWGTYVLIDIEPEVTEITQNVYGIHIRVDDDSNSSSGCTGTAYMLYLEELSNIDYGIYQSGTAPHYLQGNVGINVASALAKLDIDQSSTTAAIPVLKLDQADISEEFIRFVGTSADGVLTQSIVEEGDQASQTIAGWLKVYVQDDGNQLTDQAYFIPVYTLSA